jgi:hypothetical protein
MNALSLKKTMNALCNSSFHQLFNSPNKVHSAEHSVTYSFLRHIIPDNIKQVSTFKESMKLCFPVS